VKIAIVSDMHIGYERFAEDAFNQAKEALEKASSLADIIIMPGDIFDKRSPKPEVIAQAINIFRDLSKKKWDARVTSFNGRGSFTHTNIPVVGISGTHERAASGKENPLSLLGLAGLIVDTSEATTIIEKGNEKVAIFGLGGLSEERVKETLIELDPKPIEDAFNVFMFHQSVYELLPFSEDFIHYDDLPKGFDLYVDGHIHSKVEETVHGKKFLIPGSTVLTQLKEGEQEEKGFIIFDTNNYTYEFVKINSRKLVFKNISFERAKPGEVKEKCEQEIDGILAKSGPKPIIKLKLKGTIDLGFNNTDMPIQSIILKYSQIAILEIDNSKLVSPEMQSDIEGIRENKIGNMPVKELGMNILAAKLKDQKFDEKLDHAELFNILSDGSKKEKLLKEVLEFLNKSSTS
jgi:DNA repair exonuclease SbcCD nuclease subunit